MYFNSMTFWLVFLPVCFSLYQYVIPHPWRRIFMLGISYVFYALNAGPYLLILLGITLAAWLGGRWITRYHRLRWLVAWVGLILTPLLYIGYIQTRTSALPLGLSFYSLTALSYVIDVYRGRSEVALQPWTLMLYLAFFPTLLSGPLLRYEAMLPQWQSLSKINQSIQGDERVFRGLVLALSGLARKTLIADPLGYQVDWLVNNIANLGALGAWLAALGFAYQLYYDFWGYSQIARGIGLWLGVELPLNFNRPYHARNISEFWQRWHITLSMWLRDYLFLPISRALLRHTEPNAALLVMVIAHGVTMALAGLWHGASPMFLVWGVYHALLLSIYGATHTWHLLRRGWLNRLLTLVAALIGWIWFRSPSLAVAMTWLRTLVRPDGALPPLASLFSLIGLIGLALWLDMLVPVDLERRIPLRWHTAVLFTGLALLTLMSLSDAQQFLYIR